MYYADECAKSVEIKPSRLDPSTEKIADLSYKLGATEAHYSQSHTLVRELKETTEKLTRERDSFKRLNQIQSDEYVEINRRHDELYAKYVKLEAKKAKKTSKAKSVKKVSK
jgi:predicted esterase YcpF (UPF0227 family)